MKNTRGFVPLTQGQDCLFKEHLTYLLLKKIKEKEEKRHLNIEDYFMVRNSEELKNGSLEWYC